MDLERFCGEDFIDIPHKEWVELLQEVGEDKDKRLELTTELARLAGRYPLPIPDYTEEEICKDYQQLEVNNLDTIETEAPLRGGPYKYPFSNETWKWNQLGTVLADKYMMPVQLQASHRRYRSVASAWQELSGRRTSFNALVALKKPCVTKKMVLMGFKLRLHITGNFRPAVAKEIYNKFGNQGTVLDFSSGYGGRFIGFWASNCKHYIGVDPNSLLQEPYRQISEWLIKNHPKDKTFQFIKSPAEDVDYSCFSPDLIFTSPPYFDIERYSQEDTQSWKKYKEINVWLEKFLFTTLSKTCGCLKHGGYCLINICDSPSHEEIKICDAMCEYLEHTLRMKPQPAIKMLMTNRPGNKDKVGASRISEPIWVYQKII